MKCPLCQGVGAITHREFPAKGVKVPRHLKKNHRIVIQAIHLMTEEDLELDGVSAQDLADFCDGLGESQITLEIAQEIIVDLTKWELVQLLSWTASDDGKGWLATVVCTENGQLVAEKLEGGA